MVARGDLALECDLEEVPHLQKRIIRACVERGRPVITATQMLESMVYAPTPTRAEVSDVANAVFDGSDALMLSGETAIGHDPVAAVATMARIAERAERERGVSGVAGRAGRRRSDLALADAPSITAAMTQAAWQAAGEAGVSAILCCTRTGYTARSMARFRPHARLVALTPFDETERQLTLTWGVVPLLMPTYSTTDEMVDNAVYTAKGAGVVAIGDVVAVLAGNPAALEPATDVLRLVRVT
jgi:pyruvate kinase